MVSDSGSGLSGLAGWGLRGASTERTFRLGYRASISETLTDNVTLAPTDRKAAAITQVSAGVQLVSTGGRLRGFADYSIVGNYYTGNAASSTLLNLLSASLVGELIERRAYVDVNASITQQSLSAFGTQSYDIASANANRAEVRSYRVSPYVRGELARLASYELRASHSANRIKGSDVGDVAVNSASMLLNGAQPGRINWSAMAMHQVLDDSSTRDRTMDAVTGTVFYTPWPEVRFSIFGGREANDYLTIEKASRNVYGGRVAWTPTPRTSLLAERRESFFGDSHTITLAHRFRRSTFAFSDVKGVYVSGMSGDGVLRTTLFDYYNLQFNRVEPDPVRRAIVVDQFFRANPGLDPGVLLTSAIAMQRSQMLSYTWFGLRDSLSVYAAHTNTQRLDVRPAFVAGDLARFARIRQQGLGATLSHRLTPVSVLSANVSQQRNSGEAATGSDLATRLRATSLTWSTRLGPWASAVLTARHSRFDSSTRPYRESALTGTLNLRF